MSVSFFTKPMFLTPELRIQIKLQPEETWQDTKLVVEIVETLELHVGWILPSLINETSWALWHEEGRIYINQKYNPAVRTYREEGVYSATGENITYPALYRLIFDHNCTMIICSGMEFKIECVDIAQRFPHVQVVVLSTLSSPGAIKPLPNIAQITGKMWEAMYFAGITAGSISSTLKIGYIQTLLHPTTFAIANAFWFGVQQSCPNCQILGYYLDTFQDEWMESNAAMDLKNMGCDVMLSIADGPTPATIFANSGKSYFGIGFMTDDMREHIATSTQYQWGPMIAQQVEKLLLRQVVGPPSGLNLRGLKEEAVTIGLISPLVPQTYRNVYADELQRVLTSSWPEPVFCRFEKQWLLNNGTVLIPAVELGDRFCLSDSQRLNMDWLMHGHEWLGLYVAPPVPKVKVPFSWQTAFYAIAAAFVFLFFCYVAYVVHAWRRRLMREKYHAEERQMATNHFLTNMNHELRTPLNGLFGGISLLKYSALDDEQTENLTNIERCADALLTVVSNVLDLTSIQEGKLAVVEEDVILLEALQESIAHAGRASTQISSHVEFYLDPSVASVVKSDSARLMQILSNLLHNSIKFTSCKQSEQSSAESVFLFCSSVEANQANPVSIEITKLWLDSLKNAAVPVAHAPTTNELEQKLDMFKPRPDPGEVLLLFAVCDSGIGMSAHMQDTIFAPFTQADTSSQRKHAGTGLGLAICRELVKLVKGKIWVRSEVDRGSCFFFTIPYKPVTNAADLPQLEVKDFRSSDKSSEATDYAHALPTEAHIRAQLLLGKPMISLKRYIPRALPVLLLSTDVWGTLSFVSYLKIFGLETVVKTALTDGLLADLERLKEYDFIFIDHEHPPVYIRGRNVPPAQRTSVMAAEQLRFGGVQAKLCLVTDVFGKDKAQREALKGGNFTVFHAVLARPIILRFFLGVFSQLLDLGYQLERSTSWGDQLQESHDDRPSPLFQRSALTQPVGQGYSFENVFHGGRKLSLSNKSKSRSCSPKGSKPSTPTSLKRKVAIRTLEHLGAIDQILPPERSPREDFKCDRGVPGRSSVTSPSSHASATIAKDWQTTIDEHGSTQISTTPPSRSSSIMPVAGLPVADEPVQIPTASQLQRKKFKKCKSPLAIGLREVSILVVDDNKINRMVLTRLLKQLGIAKIQQVEDGSEAVKIAMTDSFHIIFMDLQMPVMDGFQAAKSIRSALPEARLPIIIPVTGNCTDNDRQGCREAQMQDFIEKPISQPKILGALQKWLPQAIERQNRLGSLKPAVSILNGGTEDPPLPSPGTTPL
eukprot:gb/GEZN01000422.1/.p1 GENE.gb/GEZN01000422.1/~~gb/GEZN01000422.1/.p1  ORF type:complete len:1459 (-),score=212.00 gb/GEZN01000422.1/:115-3948(-)